MTQDKPCRHEYIKIFQRRLKGLERRLVATRGYLPVGFKQTDFAHLGEGSFCFCVKCRARLYPRRSQAERAATRLALAQKASDLAGMAALAELSLDLNEAGEGDLIESGSEVAENSNSEVNVDELDYESTEMEEIAKDGVKLNEEDEEEEEFAEKDEDM